MRAKNKPRSSKRRRPNGKVAWQGKDAIGHGTAKPGITLALLAKLNTHTHTNRAV